ncbi:heterokaryon incompatibility protein-domain-containing protein [Podospora aff. communis PSN243]|uniref:Heterokaryon incompatibility protein-domain-containing protein n=1 Tax=Podospora aff. communis PSN243 TaxID=3040156 RepID=A0AAV9G7N5_9PEZI|nr:heterokaryon incompatibility protein-domain-containing protein [Podospora aff. communis PSN243]
MWLINVSTMSLESFYGTIVPPYAILSHTWEADEVSFRGFVGAGGGSNSDFVAITGKAGYRKVVAMCQFSQRKGHSYVWIDTYCIDKTSSAEPTAAINSMFSWYKNSEICYAYLSDFKSPGLTATPEDPTSDLFAATFGKCRWLKRGWCLQELLASGRPPPRKALIWNFPIAIGISPFQALCGFTSALAPRPNCFPIHHVAKRNHLGSRLNPQFSLTNRGIVFPNATLRYQKEAKAGHQYLLDLYFFGKRSTYRHMLLQKIGPGLFLRIHNSDDRQRAFADVPISSPFNKPVCVLQKVPSSSVHQPHGHWERHIHKANRQYQSK